MLPLPDPKNQSGNWGWQMQLGQNWARGQQAARKQRCCRRPGFRRQQPPLQGAMLTMRDVGLSPAPEVLFLSAKGGDGGRTIRWCPAAHTATKDFVHLKKATPTTLKSSCRYHRQLLAQSSYSQLLLPIMTLLFCQHRCACYLGQLGAVAASPPRLTSQPPGFPIRMPGSRAGRGRRCCWLPGAFPGQPSEIAGSVARRGHWLLQATLDSHHQTWSLLHKRPRGSRIDTVYTMLVHGTSSQN